MANTTAILLLCSLAVVINVVSVESAHHTTAQAPTADCSTVILSMADCLSYVTNGSTVKKPEGTCCSGLKKVLKSNADCLCEAFKNSAQFGVSLNVTRAMALPAACHLSAPSATNCGKSHGSGAAPVESPMAMDAGAPMTAAMGPGPTMALGPAPALGSSGSSGLVTSALTFALSLLLSVYFSAF